MYLFKDQKTQFPNFPFKCTSLSERFDSQITKQILRCFSRKIIQRQTLVQNLITTIGNVEALPRQLAQANLYNKRSEGRGFQIELPATHAELPTCMKQQTISFSRCQPPPVAWLNPSCISHFEILQFNALSQRILFDSKELEKASQKCAQRHIKQDLPFCCIGNLGSYWYSVCCYSERKLELRSKTFMKMRLNLNKLLLRWNHQHKRADIGSTWILGVKYGSGECRGGMATELSHGEEFQCHVTCRSRAPWLSSNCPLHYNLNSYWLIQNRSSV